MHQLPHPTQVEAVVFPVVVDPLAEVAEAEVAEVGDYLRHDN